MKFNRIWRVVAPVIGLFYCYLAFRAGLTYRLFTLGIDCFIAAVYFFGAAKAHSNVQRYGHREYDR